MIKSNSFWKPGKISNSKINNLYGFKLNPKPSKPFGYKPMPITPIKSYSQNKSLFTPKFIQPVNLKTYPVRTNSEWNLINKNPFGDKDKDRVPNIFDCKPLNKYKQDFFPFSKKKDRINMKKRNMRRKQIRVQSLATPKYKFKKENKTKLVPRAVWPKKEANKIIDKINDIKKELSNLSKNSTDIKSEGNEIELVETFLPVLKEDINKKFKINKVKLVETFLPVSEEDINKKFINLIPNFNSLSKPQQSRAIEKFILNKNRELNNLNKELSQIGNLELKKEEDVLEELKIRRRKLSRLTKSRDISEFNTVKEEIDEQKKVIDDLKLDLESVSNKGYINKNKNELNDLLIEIETMEERSPYFRNEKTGIMRMQTIIGDNEKGRNLNKDLKKLEKKWNILIDKKIEEDEERNKKDFKELTSEQKKEYNKRRKRTPEEIVDDKILEEEFKIGRKKREEEDVENKKIFDKWLSEQNSDVQRRLNKHLEKENTGKLFKIKFEDLDDDEDDEDDEDEDNTPKNKIKNIKNKTPKSNKYIKQIKKPNSSSLPLFQFKPEEIHLSLDEVRSLEGYITPNTEEQNNNIESKTKKEKTSNDNSSEDLLTGVTDVNKNTKKETVLEDEDIEDILNESLNDDLDEDVYSDGVDDEE